MMRDITDNLNWKLREFLTEELPNDHEVSLPGHPRNHKFSLRHIITTNHPLLEIFNPIDIQLDLTND